MSSRLLHNPSLRLPLDAPSDLRPAHRGALAASVLVLHGLGAWAWSHWQADTPVVVETSPLMVSMIAPEAPERVTPAPAPAPEPVKPRPVAAPTVTAARSPAPSPAAWVAPPVPAPAPVSQEALRDTPPVAQAAAPVAAPAAPVADAPPPAPQPPKQIQASAVRYLVAPQHVYPETSRRLGESGRVSLKVLVDEKGRAVDVQITQSSGYTRLDQSAVSAMRQARFQPYLENGVPRSVWAPATITYDLQD